jgi:HEAT repeat protein
MLDLDQLHDLIQTLDKGDETSRQQAIHSLKLHEEQEWASVPPKVINSLVKSLQKQVRSEMEKPSIRQEIAVVLGNLGPRAEPAIGQLIDMLQDGVPDSIREAAATALGKIGKDAVVAVDKLITLLSKGRPTLAVVAVRALSDIGCADQRVRTALVNLWLSTGQSQKSLRQVAIALCKLKIEAKGLLRYLTSTLVAGQDASLRKAAAEALAWCSKDEVDVVPALLTAALHDKDEGVRLMAQAGLDQLRLSRAKAIDLCAAQLKESSYAEMALRYSGQPAAGALIEALGSQEATTREKAARILGCFGESAIEAVPALTTTLHDKNLDVRLAAAKALWIITKTADVVVPTLVDLLAEKWAPAFDAGESRRRFLQSVVESLGRIGPPAQAATATLTKIAKNNNRHLSESAQHALREIAPAVANKVGLR